MNIKSHFCLSVHLFDDCLRATFPNGKIGFIFGSIFPDISLSYFIRPHTPAERLDTILNQIENSYSPDSKDLNCFEMGIISHYLSDFFTLPHNKGTKLYSNAHSIYEKILGKKISKILHEEQSDFPTEQNQKIDLSYDIKKRLSDYEKLPPGFESDVRCIFQINYLYILEILNLSKNKSRSKLSNQAFLYQ